MTDSGRDRVVLLRRAYAAGISPIVATDVDGYMDMTLDEIAEEWGKDPVELLAALDRAFPSTIGGETTNEIRDRLGESPRPLDWARELGKGDRNREDQGDEQR